MGDPIPSCLMVVNYFFLPLISIATPISPRIMLKSFILLFKSLILIPITAKINNEPTICIQDPIFYFRIYCGFYLAQVDPLLNQS